MKKLPGGFRRKHVFLTGGLFIGENKLMKIKYIFLVITVIAMLVVISVTIYSDDNRLTDNSPNNLRVKDIKIDPHNGNIIYAVIEKKVCTGASTRGKPGLFWRWTS